MSPARAIALMSLLLAGCAVRSGVPIGTPFAARALPGTDAASHEVPSRDPNAQLTVLVFFADHCPCQSAHDARLVDLYARTRDRGVAFYFVDSEGKGSIARDAAIARERVYPFPILRDEGARLAKELHADYATESFVFDREGHLRYHGGVDSDRKHLHDDATFFLRDAIEDLLAGKSPRVAEGEALGCSLETR